MRYKKLTRVFDANGMPKPGEVRNGYRWNGMTWVPEQKSTATTATQSQQQQSTQQTANATQSQPTTNTQTQPNPNSQGFTGPTLVDFEGQVNNQAQQAANNNTQQQQQAASATNTNTTQQNTNQQSTTPPPIPDSYVDASGNRVTQQAPTDGNATQQHTGLKPVSLADLRKQSGTGAVPVNKKRGWWERVATRIAGGNAAAKYYKNNGQSVAGGMLKQGLKNLGGLAATGVLTAATGGLGLVGGRLINSSIRNSNTSMQNARREGQMRTAYAKQLKELMNARKSGKISDEQYISMRNSALENMKNEKAKIHDIAQNGRSIANPTEGTSRVGNFFRRFLPINRNKAAVDYLNQTRDNTKWLQQQRNGQYDNKGDYHKNGGYIYNNN